QSEARRIVRAASEGFVDDHETEGAGTRLAGLQTELIGQARGQDGIGQLLFLPSRLSSGVGVMLLFPIVLAPPLRGGEGEPVADIGDPFPPTLVQFTGAVPA